MGSRIPTLYVLSTLRSSDGILSFPLRTNGLYSIVYCILLLFSLINSTKLSLLLLLYIYRIADCPNTPFILVGLKRDLKQDKDMIDRLSANHQTPVSPPFLPSFLPPFYPPTSFFQYCLFPQ